MDILPTSTSGVEAQHCQRLLNFTHSQSILGIAVLESFTDLLVLGCCICHREQRYHQTAIGIPRQVTAVKKKARVRQQEALAFWLRPTCCCNSYSQVFDGARVRHHDCAKQLLASLHHMNLKTSCGSLVIDKWRD